MKKLFRAFIVFLSVSGAAHAGSWVQTVPLENTFDTWFSGPRQFNLAQFDTALGQLQSVSFNTVLNLSAYLDVTNDTNSPYELSAGGGTVHIVAWRTWPYFYGPPLDSFALSVNFDAQSIDGMSSSRFYLSPNHTTSSAVLLPSDLPTWIQTEWMEIHFFTSSSPQGLQYWNDGTQPGPIGIVSSNLVFTTSGAITITYDYISAVPEPETYALLLAGLGLMGTLFRRPTVAQVRG